jgi:two-component system, OmpR family, sensor kinase
MTYRRYLLPAALGIFGLLLLIRVFVSNANIFVPEDLDIILLVTFLSVAMIAAIHTIVRLSMRYLRIISIRQMRHETLAEHGRFLRRLDHELKNPLTTLRAGFSTLSLTELDEQQRHLIKTMETETLRLSKLVIDLRKLAELEAQPLNLQTILIETFINNIIQLNQERFEAGNRELTYQIHTKRQEWTADEDLLTLAVHNLIDNAYKYTRPDDSISLEVFHAQSELIIRVTDTGLGIPAQHLPHIWEELYRGEQMGKTSGSGVGLALVKAIVERHHGAVNIESEEGQGTAVSIFLPPLSQSNDTMFQNLNTS